MSQRIAPESLVGTELVLAGERWQISQYLASGGLAHLYLARSTAHRERPVAVAKVLRPEADDRQDARARFDREARAAIRVRHPNVIEVMAPAAQSGGLHFFLAEHLVGVDLADLLASQKRLSPSRALRIAIGAARGLEAAHAAGVVHRDVKPENIFLEHAADGREIAKIVDFGSAWVTGDESAIPASRRITVTTGFVGTPGYVAPEQAEGAVGAPEADVYSLGVVLYELLVGEPPFRGRNWIELVHLHATAPAPVVRGVSPSLEAAIRRAMGKRPPDRFPTMAALAAALAATPEAATG